MTLEEKIGQLNMPCVYEPPLGKEIESKIEGCRKFVAGTIRTRNRAGWRFDANARHLMP